MVDYNSGNLSDILNQQSWDLYNTAPYGSFGAANQKDEVAQGINVFQNAYKNLTGQDPTTDQINQFAQNALFNAFAAPGNLTYNDSSSLANNYIQQTFPQQVAGYAQQQQTDQLGKTQQTIQDLISKQTAATASDLTNPNSPTYQSFSGLMNNLGITPSSGAFQAGMGGVLGQSAANAENAALGGVSLPAISGIQGLSGFGLGQAQGQSNLSHLNQMSDFGLQEQLASMLADNAKPSGLQTGIGEASSLINALANAGPATAAASKITWICTAMREAGVISQDEINQLHDHLYKAKWKRPLKFLGYFLFGKCLVLLANSARTDWRIWKPVFYDEVMSEPDPIKALDLYEQAFWQLFRVVRRRMEVSYGS